jgi:nicotinate-nucleotide--dimethylbenzimidazole phosphoribosyltransferase
MIKTREQLHEFISMIGPIDLSVATEVKRLHSQLTKPEGSLGRLEPIGAQIAAMRKNTRPGWKNKCAIVMVADHGVASEGVSAYPQSVTIQMLSNFSSGGAAINVFARCVGCRLRIVDVGTNSTDESSPSIKYRRVSRGTQNILYGPAMTTPQALTAIGIGIESFLEEHKLGIDIFATGDMGIANTTASSAITAVICNRDPSEVTGPGSGLNKEDLQKKIRVIERALEVNSPDRNDPIDILRKVGGFEVAAIAGTILVAAAHRVPIILDGFISGAAALIATSLAPQCKDYLIAAHLSTEPGHRILLESLGLKPLLNLDLRLGEGTGALLAMPIIEMACRVLSEMATFESAKISRKLS